MGVLVRPDGGIPAPSRLTLSRHPHLLPYFFSDFENACPFLNIVDQVFSIWYHYPIRDTGYYLWRRLPCTASSERRYRDDQKRTPRNIDTQHEGTKLHRGCLGKVAAEIPFRVILFSFTNCILLSTSISHVEASMVLPFTSLPLMPVLLVACIFAH